MQRNMTVWSVGFPCGSGVKNPQAIQEPQETQIPGWEDPLKEGRQPSSILLPGKPNG